MSQEESKATSEASKTPQITDEGFSSIFGSSMIAEPASETTDDKAAAVAAPGATPGTDSAVYQQKMNILQQQMQFKQQQQNQMIQYQQMIANMPPQQQQIMQAQMITMQHQQQQYQQAILMKQQHQMQQQQKIQSKKKGGDGKAKKEDEAEVAKDLPTQDTQGDSSDLAASEKPADVTSHAAGAAFGVPLNNPSQIQAANAQAQMFAAFNYQQQQQKYNNTINSLNQMNQYNQMNPLYVQQQMINQMQYRQPHYQNQGNKNWQQNNQNRQKNQSQQAQDSEKGESGKQNSGSSQAVPEKYDEKQLSQQLEFIQKLTLEKSGGDESLKNEEQRVQELQTKLQALVANLVDKIQKKHESLMISQQQLTMYQDTLKQKYNPIFLQMDEILVQKKFEYLDHLTRQLEDNNDRILLEKETLHKMEKSFNEIKPRFKNILEDQLTNIEKQIAKQKKMHEEAERIQKEAEAKKEEEKKNEEPSLDDEEDKAAAKSKDKDAKKEDTEDKKDADAKEDEEATENKDDKIAEAELLQDPVDSDKIKAITSMVDEFNNIVAKNFSVYAQYDDFSFANSRSSDNIDEKLTLFFKEHFSGEFQLKNSFEPSVLPRIFYLEQRTKFIYSYKIMNYMTQAIMIQNKFNIADQTRYVITPKGHLFMIGGYNPQTKEFLSESYVLDEYRSLFKMLNGMFYPRSEHVVHQYKDNIYVLGGMAYRDEKNGGMPYVQSLNTCEFFSISSKKWIMLPNFEKPRQGFSVCQFNEKYIFILGGKCLRPEARIGDKLQFDYVQEVEAFDIEKNTWKTINYINDNYKLRIIHGGATQVTGKKIMIFGGLVQPNEDDEDSQKLIDNGQEVKLSNQSFYLDVVKGSVKRGPDLATPSYYINNGGNLLCISNKLYAQGFGLNHDLNKSAINALSATAGDSKPGEKSTLAESSKDASSTYHHKKILHCYNQVDQEFTEIHEGIFSAGSANRKQSMDLDD